MLLVVLGETLLLKPICIFNISDLYASINHFKNYYFFQEMHANNIPSSQCSKEPLKTRLCKFKKVKKNFSEKENSSNTTKQTSIISHYYVSIKL